MTTRRFGIEIEALGMTPAEVRDLLEANGITCHNSGYTHRVISDWKVVTDASLPRNGFEVVSPPLSGIEGLAEVKKVVEILNDAGCDIDKSCGLHVHVEINDCSAQHIANIYNRYREYEEQVDSFMPRSRRANSNSLCKSIKDQAALQPVGTDEYATTRQRRDRYQKVNLCSYTKYGTIEFRHHSGSLNRSKITNWIKFLLQFVEVSKPVETFMVEENTESSSLSLTGQSRAIVDLLDESIIGCSANYLARRLATTKASIQSTVCRLRRRGYHITTGRTYRLIAGETSRGAVRVVPTSDSLWNGIDQAIKSYYTRRIAIMGA